MTTEQPRPDDPLLSASTDVDPPASGVTDPQSDRGPLWPPNAPAAASTSVIDRPAWAPPREEPGHGLPSVARVIGSILLLVAVFAAGIGGGKNDAPGTAPGSGSPAVNASLPPQFSTYLEAWQKLHDNYVDPSALDNQKLIYGSIDGLVQAVGDTGHTRFLTPDQVAEEKVQLNGVVGIGAVMDTSSDVPIIQSVIPDGPADRAGLRSGDKVLTVDGVSTDGQDIGAVVKRIRGDAGTTVKLSILHAGDTDPVNYSIVREHVTNPAVSWSLIPGTTLADIRLAEFSDGAAKQLIAAITAAKAAGATGIVLDLRGNPGGYVGEAIDVASQFLKDGIVFQQRDRSGKVTTSPVKSGGLATAIPLAVLVDLGTASSSEIVAGALQDAGRAKLVGHTTFGTGTVLSEYNLSDGSSMFIGTVEWLTRDGRQIWKKGVEPDFPLESTPAGTIVAPSALSKLSVDGLAASGDAQLLKAIELLKGN